MRRVSATPRAMEVVVWETLIVGHIGNIDGELFDAKRVQQRKEKVSRLSSKNESAQF